MSVLEHLRDLDSSVSEFFRVLRRGGLAIVGVPVENLMSTIMLRAGYLIGCPNARLEDEHVSNDIDVHKALGKQFKVEDVLNIPRIVPRTFRMYRTVRFRKT